jgi:hypothetical protein
MARRRRRWSQAIVRSTTPAIMAEFLAAFDAAAPAGGATGAGIIGLVAMHFVGTAAASPARAPDRRDRVEGGFEHQAVVAIGRAQQAGKRGAAAIDHDMVLGPQLAAIGCVRAAPFLPAPRRCRSPPGSRRSGRPRRAGRAGRGGSASTHAIPALVVRTDIWHPAGKAPSLGRGLSRLGSVRRYH